MGDKMVMERFGSDRNSTTSTITSVTAMIENVVGSKPIFLGMVLII